MDINICDVKKGMLLTCKTGGFEALYKNGVYKVKEINQAKALVKFEKTGQKNYPIYYFDFHFEEGMKVKRTKGSFENAREGEIYTIKQICRNGSLDLKELGDGFHYSRSRFTPVIERPELEEGDEVLIAYTSPRKIGKIISVMDKPDDYGCQYVVEYVNNGDTKYNLASRDNLKKMKQADNLDLDDTFWDIQTSSRWQVLSKARDEKNYQIVYFAKELEEGRVNHFTADQIKVPLETERGD